MELDQKGPLTTENSTHNITNDEKQKENCAANQFFSSLLESKHNDGELTPEDLRKKLPTYLTKAIDYVTGTPTNTLSEEVSVNE